MLTSQDARTGLAEISICVPIVSASLLVREDSVCAPSTKNGLTRACGYRVQRAQACGRDSGTPYDPIMRRAVLGVLTSALLAACTHAAPPTPASNVTSPAPVAVERDSRGQCLMFPIRAQHVRPSELVGVLGAQVPTWLPEDFGLQVGWRSGDDVLDGGSRGAIWSDERCRLVMLEVFPGAADEESPRPAHR